MFWRIVESRAMQMLGVAAVVVGALTIAATAQAGFDIFWWLYR